MQNVHVLIYFCVMLISRIVVVESNQTTFAVDKEPAILFGDAVNATSISEVKGLVSENYADSPCGKLPIQLVPNGDGLVMIMPPIGLVCVTADILSSGRLIDMMQKALLGLHLNFSDASPANLIEVPKIRDLFKNVSSDSVLLPTFTASYLTTLLDFSFTHEVEAIKQAILNRVEALPDSSPEDLVIRSFLGLNPLSTEAELGHLISLRLNKFIESYDESSGDGSPIADTSIANSDSLRDRRQKVLEEDTTNGIERDLDFTRRDTVGNFTAGRKQYILPDRSPTAPTRSNSWSNLFGGLRGRVSEPVEMTLGDVVTSV